MEHGFAVPCWRYVADGQISRHGVYILSNGRSAISGTWDLGIGEVTRPALVDRGDGKIVVDGDFITADAHRTRQDDR